MTISRKTIFISDLHLHENQPHTADYFKNLLKLAPNYVEAMYILGDFFEAWIGDDSCSAFEQGIIDAMVRAHDQGLAIYLMRGNRDFLLGQRFARKSKSTLLQDEICISLYGHRILLMHGDTLCTDDIDYQRARKILRHRFLHLLFLSLPLEFRKKIAFNLRKKSQRHTQTIPPLQMDVNPVAVIEKMNEYSATHLIHGHTHQPGIHTKIANNKVRIVLGAWGLKANMLVFTENHDITLIDFDESSLLAQLNSDHSPKSVIVN